MELALALASPAVKPTTGITQPLDREIQPMNMKHTLLATATAAVLGAMAFASAVSAAVPDGTITFQGTITAASCTVAGPTSSGSNSFAVTLPTTSANTLMVAGPGAYATSKTPFSMTLSNCPAGSKVGVQFYSASNVDTAATGTLKNTGVTGVDVQLLDGSNNPVTIATAAPTGNTNVTDQTTVPSSGSATVTLSYAAQYYVTSATVGGGAVSTATQYIINYQ
jgi:major type 1 subunit fimbrin (pilin)